MCLGPLLESTDVLIPLEYHRNKKTYHGSFHVIMNASVYGLSSANNRQTIDQLLNDLHTNINNYSSVRGKGYVSFQDKLFEVVAHHQKELPETTSYILVLASEGGILIVGEKDERYRFRKLCVVHGKEARYHLETFGTKMSVLFA